MNRDRSRGSPLMEAAGEGHLEARDWAGGDFRVVGERKGFIPTDARESPPWQKGHGDAFGNLPLEKKRGRDPASVILLEISRLKNETQLHFCLFSLFFPACDLLRTPS